ncbi:ferric siderophore receptor [Oxalicibacterium flavum]|uniref:Ferric siderophore receptor n=1 Tax=Oxalicibacterium flavum TaxID=179467 RepID=A0A8J2UN53_9BURK|nr:TonB-dependent siderophore receptor [Oxalicibacterium flavum]GGC02501.1 ferric siderophore receptor [Oxalicibacterium flavum]
MKRLSRLTLPLLRPTVAALCIAAAYPSFMHAAHAQAVAGARQSFDIPAGPLDATLTRIARQGGQVLSVPPELVRGLRAPAVQGELTSSEAYAQALRGSGLEMTVGGSGTLTVRQAPAAAGDAVLPAVSVTTQAETVGYVARRSSAGTKTDTPLVEIPQSVSVITAQEMRDRNAQSVAQAIQYTPGVQVNNFGGNEIRNDWVVLRGFDAKLTGDYRDGMSQMPYDQLRARTPAYGLERVEVVRGPSSVLFGQVEPGGIVNRVTKRPQAERLREVEVQLGSFDHRQVGVDIGDALDADGKLLYRLTALVRDSKTQDRYDAGHRYQDDTVYLAPSFSWRISPDTAVTVLASYQHDVNDGESRPIYPTRYLSGDYSFDRNERDVYSLAYFLDHRFNDTFSFRQSVRYQDGAIDLRNLYQLGLQADGHTMNRYAMTSHQNAHSLVMDNQLQANWSQGRLTHQVLAGIDYKMLDAYSWYRNGLAPSLDLLNPVYGQDIPMPTAAGTWLDQAERTTQLGFYLQDQIRFDDKWVLTLGARHDSARNRLDNRLPGAESSNVKSSKWTGRVAMAYVSDAGFVPYVSYATSFLPQAGTDPDGNAFKPTTGQQVEAGIKYQPKGSNSLATLSVFDLTQQNVLTTHPLYPTFNVQTGEINSKGVELELKTELSKSVNVAASYTYNDVEVTRSNTANLGKMPIVTPKNMASAWLNYTQHGGALDGLGLGIGVRYVGTTYVNVTNTLENDSATLFDASLRYGIGKWMLGLSANNLFDTETVVCRNSMLNCRYGIERSVLATASYRW